MESGLKHQTFYIGARHSPVPSVLEKDLNEKHFFQKKGENVHNFHPRPPSIIVPIATAAHSPTHGESPLLRYQWQGSRQEVNQSWPSYRCSAK